MPVTRAKGYIENDLHCRDSDIVVMPSLPARLDTMTLVPMSKK